MRDPYAQKQRPATRRNKYAPRHAGRGRIRRPTIGLRLLVDLARLGWEVIKSLAEAGLPW